MKPKNPAVMTTEFQEQVPDGPYPYPGPARPRGADMPEWRQEALLRSAQSGDLAQPWREAPVPNQDRSRQSIEDAEDVRALRGGLPDSSDEMPAVAVEQKPFKL